MPTLDDFLLAARREADNPTLPGPLNNLPSHVKRAIADAALNTPLAGPGVRAALPLIDPLKQRAVEASKVLTGGLEAGLGKLQTSPLIRAGGTTEEQARQQALARNDLFVQALLGFEQGQGNPIQRARAANEGGARGHGFEQGVYNAFLDPTNLLPMPGGGLGDALKAGRAEKNVAGLLAGVEQAGAGNDLAMLIEDAGRNLPLAPEKKDLAAYMKALGLDKPAAVENLPSSLTPERTPNLLQLAREAQGGKALDLMAPVRGGKRVNPGQLDLPPSIPATKLDQFLATAGSVTGELPPSGSEFWARRGIAPEEVPAMMDAARNAGMLGQTADALLPGVDIPSLASPAPELPQGGGGVRALNAAVNLAYGGKQGFAFPALLKRIGGRVDGTGAIWVGDKNVTTDVFEYLFSSSEAKGEKAKNVLRDQLAARVGGQSLLNKAGLGSSVNFTMPGLNAAATLGMKALDTPYLGTGIIGAGIGAGTGASMGAASGGLLGALGTPEDRWQGFKEGAIQGAEGGAVLGAAIGAAGGAYGLSHLTSTAIKDLGKNSYGLALEAQKEAVLKSGKVAFTPKQLFAYWGNQTVSTARQWIQDGVWNKLVLQAAQGKDSTKLLGTITEDIAANLRLKGNDRLSTPVQDLLGMVGNPQRELDLGVPLMTEIGKNDFSMTQSIGASTLLSALGGPTNLLGLGAAAVKGAVMPGWSRFLHVSNGAINRAFREAALVDEMGKLTSIGVEEFGKLGYDLSILPVSDLSAAKVASLHGARAGAMWQQVLDNGLEMSQSRVRYLFGDYGNKGTIERLVGTGIPFASWAIRAYPVALDMAIQHPWVALGIYQYLNATSKGAGKDGRPGYTAGMVGLSTETPVAGAGVRSLLGGQRGMGYIDPVAGISPVGGSMFQPQDETSPNPSLYQKVSDALGRTGLPGLNPLVSAVAYIVGLDYRAPTNLSRTQGLENSLGLVPGNINIPDFGGAGLRALRAKASPTFAATELGAKLGAAGDAHPTVFDPVARRYGELVVASTGLSLNDPRNRAYLYDLAAGTGELYDQAKRETLIAGATKNAFSLTSPTSAVTQSEDNRKARVAKAGTPATYADLLAQQNGPNAPGVGMPTLATANTKYKQANPWAAAYDVGSVDEGRAMLMQDALARYKIPSGRQFSPSSPQQLQQVMAINQQRAEAQRIPAKKK